jgi:transposase-like protein
MARKKTGTGPQEVAPDIERALTKARTAVLKAREATDKAIDLMDNEISRAYMGGVNVNRIATLVGVTRKTVYTSLERTGAIDSE